MNGQPKPGEVILDTLSPEATLARRGLRLHTTRRAGDNWSRKTVSIYAPEMRLCRQIVKKYGYPERKLATPSYWLARLDARAEQLHKAAILEFGLPATTTPQQLADFHDRCVGPAGAYHPPKAEALNTEGADSAQLAVA